MGQEVVVVFLHLSSYVSTVMMLNFSMVTKRTKAKTRKTHASSKSDGPRFGS
jgi:hypothetical protein